MPKKIGAEDLVAHYLRSRGYNDALESFIREAGLPTKVGEGLEQSWTLEHILEEKRLYDLTLKFESTELVDELALWSGQYPSEPRRIYLEPLSNVLQVNLVELRANDSEVIEQVLLVSTAARQLCKVKVQDGATHIWSTINVTPDSPILSFIVLLHRYILFTTISGGLVLYDTVEDETLAKRKDHQKYAVQVISTIQQDQTYVATAGWDNRVHLYTIAEDNGCPALSEPVATIELPSVPESIVFVVDQQEARLHLIIGRRDSTFLYYHEVRASNADDPSSPASLRLAGKQNLAPYATMWNAFSPAYMALCPRDPTLLAVATNSTPHMKVLLVRLIFPQQTSAASAAAAAATASSAAVSSARPTETTAADGRDVDPREVAAVLAHTNTNVAQTRFSTPVVAWRPDGSGFWVNSEEGTVKGIDRAGKVQAVLQGHEYASKVRCLCAGLVRSVDDATVETEVLISGGFDQKLLMWQP